MIERSTEAIVSSVDEALFSGAGSFGAFTLAALWNVVPAGVSAGMCPTSVNVAVAAAGKSVALQLIVPPDPPAGVVQLIAGPLFCVNETNVIVPGSVSDHDNVAAASGPALVTPIV